METRKVETVSYPVVSQDQLRAFVQEVVAEAQELVIDSDDMYEIAGELLGKVMGRKKALAAQLKSITDPLLIAENNARTLFKPAQASIAQAESILKTGMANRVRQKDEEERIARQKAAQAAALEQARLDAEALAAADAAAAAEGTPEAEEALFAAQEAAEAAALPVLPVAQLPTKAKAAGISAKRKYVGEVTDPIALFRYCADHPEWQSLFELKQGELNKKANALGAALKLPGVVVRQEVGIAAKAA